MTQLIYLASPFTHPDPMVRARRVEEARQATIELLRKKLAIFSPILYTSTIPDAPIPFEAWTFFNDAMIARCHKLWVLNIDGWYESRGVDHELFVAKLHGLPTRLLTLLGNGNYSEHPL